MVTQLAARVRTALETYSNVHRGSGHNSVISTHLYERARDVVLEHLGLDRSRHTVVFCSPRQAELLQSRLGRAGCQVISSQDLGLPLGLRAVAVRRRALPGGPPPQSGGGTARLVGPGWVVWARTPDRFEAGTPAIVNVVALATALRLGRDALGAESAEERTASDILYHDRLEGYSGQELLVELRKTLIGQRNDVPTATGPRPFVNLDNAASTPTFEPIWDAVLQGWSQPEPVRREIVAEARSICADFLHAPSTEYDVVFTSNTTEAINLVAESLGRERDEATSPVVVGTTMEHNSNELPWRGLAGVPLLHLPVDPEGFIDLEGLEALLREYNERHDHGPSRIRLVTVSGASNVLGTCNDLAAIGRLAHAHGARLLVDAAQLVAHREVDMAASQIDYLTLSAHKSYAPFGTGALVARRGLLRFTPEEMASIHMSGEENVGGIAALGKALVLLRRIGLDVIQREERELTARALRGMARIPGVTAYGVSDPESPRFASRGGVLLFRVTGTMAGQVADELAQRGALGIRSGCHCAHTMIKTLLAVSQPLERFQRVLVTLFPRVALPGLARASLGIENTPEDVDQFLDVLELVARKSPAGADGPARTGKEVRREMAALAHATARAVYPDSARR